MRLRSFAFLLLIVSAALAQSERGTITGTVVDPAGGVVANATVQATNTATAGVYSAATSATGNYTIAQLPAGTYELSVTAPGFKRYVRAGIPVEVAGTVRIDATLEVGATTESITVEAAAPLLKTESGEISYNFQTQTLDDIPLFTLSGAPPGFGNSSGLGNIRNPLASVELLPGSHFATDNTLRINGMPSSSQTINIEGQDSTNGLWRQLTQLNQAGADAIQEVAIQTSNYAAEYGGAGGGYFNYSMKSGTNQYHGSGYDYFVNEILYAGLPNTDAGTINPAKEGQHIRNPIRQNDYGVTFGGPVFVPRIYNGRDKTFFFFSFEQFRQTNFTTNTQAIVPTPAQRTGDFSAALIPVCPGTDALGQKICWNEVFDPASTTVVNGQTVRTPFANNMVPLIRIDPTPSFRT